MRALRQPVKTVHQSKLHPSSGDHEIFGEHQWLAETRMAWERKRGQSAPAHSDSCLHPLLQRLARVARATLWAVRRAIAVWTPKSGCLELWCLATAADRRFCHR